MANSFWQHTSQFLAGTLVRADSMNSKLNGIEAGFELVEARLDAQITLPPEFTGNTTIPNQTFANKIVYIDGSGNLGLYSISGFQTDVANTATNASTASSAASAAAASASAASTYASNAAQSAAGMMLTSATVRTSNFTAAVNVRYLIDTSAGAFTMTLPASPLVGDRVGFIDHAASFGQNNLTIGRNSLKIMALAEDLICDVRYFAGEIEYTGTAKGWVLI